MMGGYGSGWWHDHYAKTTAESCNVIDVNVMQHEGYLRPGIISTWTWWRSGPRYDFGTEQRKDRIEVVATSEGIQLHYTVTVNDTASPYDYAIPVVWVPCNYGGKRPYFICQGVKNNVPCHRRVAKLYRPPSSSYFLCRHCHGLTYESSNESGDLHYTARRWTRRIARKLGLSEPEDVYTMDKPKGMHNKTFKRLERDLIEAMDYEEWAFELALEKLSIKA